MGEEFKQEVAFQKIYTWLMEDVNKNKNTNLYAVTLEKAASTLDLTLDLSWLLDQSTIDFLLSN